MGKQRLVVIGNGMAGARAVEEVLARGGAEQFDITMFGDEPYGNYNRILLSNVLSGAQDTDEIYLNTLDWYDLNGIHLHAGHMVTGDRSCCPQGLRRRRGRRTLRQAADRDRQPGVHPAMANVYARPGILLPGVFAFRTLDDCDGIVAAAKQSKKGGRDRRRPARAGSGARPAHPRLRGARRPPRQVPDGAAARSPTAPPSSSATWRRWASMCIWRSRPRPCWATAG